MSFLLKGKCNAFLSLLFFPLLFTAYGALGVGSMAEAAWSKFGSLG